MKEKQTSPQRPQTNPKITRPRLHHIFRVDKVFDKLIEVCVKKNAELMVEVLDMPKLKNVAVTTRHGIKKNESRLDEVWQKMQVAENSPRALFGTHLKLKDESAVNSLMKRLEPWYKFNNLYDLQRFYGFPLNGLNEPMFFFKSDGAWTGLHNEDCGLASFNVNIGPGTSRWTLIHQDDIPKLSAALKKEQKLRKEKDVRLLRHQFYFSEAFLSKHQIPYEVVDQQPGYALYAPGYAFHQVRNTNHGLNIAWNVALMCPESINDMMAGHDFEVHRHQMIAMVPVLRVIHGLYFTHRDILFHHQLVDFPQYLLKYLRIEKVDYDVAQQKNETKKRKIKTERVQRFSHNNCEECTRYFYCSAFMWNDGDRNVEYCWKCISKLPKTQDIRRHNIFDESELIKYLEDRVDEVPEGDQEELHRAYWWYPNNVSKPLKWVEQMRFGESLLDLLQRSGKDKKNHEQIEMVEQKIEDLWTKADNALTKRQHEEYMTAIDKQLSHLEKLKKCKERLDAVNVNKLEL